MPSAPWIGTVIGVLRLFRIVVPCLGLGALAAACTGAGADTSADADVSSRSEGIVFVERVDDGSGARVHVGGRFVRATGIAADGLWELVGAPPSPPPSGCVERTASADLADSVRAEVQLLDLGAITARSESLSTRMVPHRLPDLWNVVSGVVYGADGDGAGASWQFTGTGDAASGRGAFDVAGSAPEPLGDVRLGDQPLPSTVGAAWLLPRQGAISVRWSHGSVADRVAVVVEGAGTLTCGARDDGSLDLDGATADRARELLRQGGTLAVHRLRTVPFTVRGVDRASLVFDQAVRVRVQ